MAVQIFDESEQMFIMWITTLMAVIGLLVLCGYGCHQTELTNRERFKADQDAIKAGLVQGSIPGQTGVYWVKPEGK